MLLSPKSPVVRSLAVRAATEHPFLIVRKSDYAGLQARAAEWPWSEQKEAALEDAARLRYHAAAPIDVRAITLAKIFSTTALAYILDPDNRPRYVARIVEHLRPFDESVSNGITAAMRANADKTLWRYAVPTGNAFFQGVLALDLIHDDLPANQLTEIEGFLRDGPARYFRETNLAWKQGTHAAAAIFALYERDEAVYLPLVGAWKEHTLEAISEDGVFLGGAAYADARWSFADRENKSLFGDVLAHTGILPDWYAEPKVGKFLEWLNGYAYTPFRMLWSFGDSGPDKFSGNYQPGGERAYRFSGLAGRYAAWLRDGLTPPGALGSYVLAAEPPAEPLVAPSRVFTDGGAWLKEASPDRRALSAALWNLATEGDAHTHKETNSVCLAAYGEMLLRAGGYNGWATPEQGFSWAYIHDRAIAGNVVLFDYAVPATAAEERSPSAVNDHARTCGAGITLSLLTGSIDFARGDSDRAIPNGHHVRNFVFIHPADGVGGYYVSFDDLTASPGATGQVVWHPASATYATTAERQEYTWMTNEFGGANVSLTVFLATPPTEVMLRDGILANWGRGVIGKYLVAHYPIGSAGVERVMTVLFPQDDWHPKADLTRTRSDDGRVTTAVVRQGEVKDQLFQADGQAGVCLADGVLARARAGWVRYRASDPVDQFWLMDAFAVATPQFVFASSAGAQIVRSGNRLDMSIDRTSEVRFDVTGLRAIECGGAASRSFAATNGIIEMRLEPGTHRMDLVFGDVTEVD